MHSHFSLLDGVSQPHQIAQRIEELGLAGSALSDHGGINGSVAFYQEMNKVDKKAIFGNEFYVCFGDAKDKSPENKKKVHQVILAKNLDGWYDLVEMTSESNHPDHFYYKPRVDFEMLARYGGRGNLVSFSGHLGSILANAIMENDKLIPDWQGVGGRWAKKLQDIFGKENFFIEIQMIDGDKLPCANILGNALRQISIDTGIPCVATADSHYISKDRAMDQRVLLCNNLNTNFKKIKYASNNDGLYHFFKSNNYHIPSSEEMYEVNTEEEIDNTLVIADMCESFDITRRPLLPTLRGPGGEDENEYLRHLCREGWRQKIEKRIAKSQHTLYADRVKRELDVLQGAGLSSYFLILADVLDYTRNAEWLTGPGRGSAAGSLVSYLTGITKIDPIQYGLIFERFYNAGRNTKDRISYPDIDIDVPVQHRESIVQYIKSKYGEDRVGQITSFQTMKGRGALKAVFRAYGELSFSEMNEITDPIPDEAKIADELQEMKDEEGESSIIKWTLENRKEEMKDYCQLNDDGTFTGQFALEFEQAIRLERTKTSQSKHPAGVVICDRPLSTVCPMVYDSTTKKQIIGYEMNDAESAGLLKFDVLGVQVLDKLMTVSELLSTGEIS